MAKSFKTEGFLTSGTPLSQNIIENYLSTVKSIWILSPRSEQIHNPYAPLLFPSVCKHKDRHFIGIGILTIVGRQP